MIHRMWVSAVALIVFPFTCCADIGPKPNFTFYFDESIALDSDVKLLTCEQSSCENQGTFREIGPQRLDCQEFSVKEKHACFVMAYGFPPFLKLRITSGSNSIDSDAFVPGGDVDVQLVQGRLVVKKRFISRLFCWWC